MTLKDIMNHLKSKGWDCKRDQIGDRYAIKEFEGLQIQLLPILDKRKNYIVFSLAPSLSLKQYSEICALLMEEKNDFEPLISRYGWPKLSLEMDSFPQKEFEELSLANIDSLEIEAMEWARKQDINKAIEYYANLPTDSAGSLPLNHLAALIIQKNKEQLEYYKQSFIEGNRLGFVPYITDKVINRAVQLANSKQ
ncbi:DUF6990 domain-containing protein [Neisseria lisongii]|uniref:DUF4304 domain-containing protein n=1 Tax=Neisseria lisongii TaxID=2912188 RepID=A0AAW5ACM7_9NEIS|nr:hypothetical protein [Neisseria lisongii]MCF7528810.1 hypothetical protein [Neisseria lisongii]